MSTPRARSALRRNIVIAACAVGLVAVVGLVAERRDAARTPPAEQQAKFPAVQQQRMAEGSTPGLDSPAAKPVVMAVVKPWIEIARMPQYVQASSAEREAIRDLYWRICVEEKVPPVHRKSAHRRFVRAWDIAESGAPETGTRSTSVPQYLREQQAAAPSPVDAATMRRACQS